MQQGFYRFSGPGNAHSIGNAMEKDVLFVATVLFLLYPAEGQCLLVTRLKYCIRKMYI